MSKKIIALLASAIAILTLSISPVARAADEFTISGKLETTSPKDNQYEGNYKLVTSDGQTYYLKLEKDFYKKWVGQETYFHVVGGYSNFVVYSSGQGTRANTTPTELPKTGTPVGLLGAISLLGAIPYMIWQYRKRQAVPQFA